MPRPLLRSAFVFFLRLLLLTEAGNAPQIAKFELARLVSSPIVVLGKLILFYFIPFHFMLFSRYLLILLLEIDSNFLCTFRISYDYASIIINANFL